MRGRTGRGEATLNTRQTSGCTVGCQCVLAIVEDSRVYTCLHLRLAACKITKPKQERNLPGYEKSLHRIQDLVEPIPAPVHTSLTTSTRDGLG